MSTTTAVQLEALGNATPYEASSSTLRPRAGLADYTPSNQNDSDDPALEASRIADSTVPDGGYGWVVIIACAG